MEVYPLWESHSPRISICVPPLAKKARSHCSCEHDYTASNLGFRRSALRSTYVPRRSKGLRPCPDLQVRPQTLKSITLAHYVCISDSSNDRIIHESSSFTPVGPGTRSSVPFISTPDRMRIISPQKSPRRILESNPPPPLLGPLHH